MPRYSIKDLAIAAAMVAIGLSAARFGGTYSPDWFRESLLRNVVEIVSFVGGWMLAGAGITYPFKMTYVGSFLGLVVGLAVIVQR